MFFKNARWDFKKESNSTFKPIDRNTGFKLGVSTPSRHLFSARLKERMNCIKERGIKKGVQIKTLDGRNLIVDRVNHKKGEIKAEGYPYPINPFSVEVVI
ncbi:MAG: hypothetical protein R6V40_03850 [Candidatus Moraniibacteriota bacterium]